MEVLVRRLYKKDKYTIGTVSINSKYFCESLEDKDRGLTQDMSLSEILKIKVKGKTAIPAGRYRIILSYSTKFKKILPEILSVKGFGGVRIHSGNDENDTDGCQLYGQNKIKGKLVNSRVTMKDFIQRLSEAESKGEESFLTII